MTPEQIRERLEEILEPVYWKNRDTGEIWHTGDELKPTEKQPVIIVRAYKTKEMMIEQIIELMQKEK